MDFLTAAELDPKPTMERVCRLRKGFARWLSAGRSVEKLTGSALTFFNCGHVTRVSRQIRVGECNPPKRRIAQDIPEGWLSVLAKEEPRLRTGVRMTPTIENDARDIAPGVETG